MDIGLWNTARCHPAPSYTVKVEDDVCGECREDLQYLQPQQQQGGYFGEWKEYWDGKKVEELVEGFR